MQDDEPLLIDLQAAAEVPSVGELSAWASEQRVFISSTMDDMADERKAVEVAVRAIGAEPVTFEQFGGMDGYPGDAYLGHVGSSTIYVGLLGRRYGHLSRDGYSATHAEYRKAKEDGLRISVWIDNRAKADMEGNQVSFLNEVQVFHVTGSFDSPEDLHDRVTRRLKAIAAEELSPWVRVGNVVIRGREIVDDGSGATVTSYVRNKYVRAALSAMQERTAARWGVSGLPFACANMARTVDVQAVTTKTTSGAGQEFALALRSSRQQHESVMRGVNVVVNGAQFTAQELVVRQLRAGLFGEDCLVPGGLFQTPADPLSPLRGKALPDEVVRPVARLLMTEWLVREGQADALTEFRFGPRRQGLRKLAVSWRERSRYRNVAPGDYSIEGDVADV